jgi:hypothetical protein
MRALHVNKLILCPRINEAVINSLEYEEKTWITVAERSVNFTPELQEMYQLLIEIM